MPPAAGTGETGELVAGAELVAAAELVGGAVLGAGVGWLTAAERVAGAAEPPASIATLPASIATPPVAIATPPVAIRDAEPLDLPLEPRALAVMRAAELLVVDPFALEVFAIDDARVVWTTSTAACAVAALAPQTRPLGCWRSRPSITDSMREPEPIGPGG